MATGDALKKVRPGDRLRIPAKAYNAFVEAAAAHRAGQSSLDRTFQRGHAWQSGIVPVRNDTGADRDRLSVLAIDGPVFAPDNGGGAADDAFIRRVVLKGTTPSRPSDVGWFVITLEPIGAGKIGRACVSGVCPALVKYEEDFHYFADITDGDSGKLTSGERGAAELLWVSDSAGGSGAILAVVRLANYPPSLHWAKVSSDWSSGNTIDANPCNDDGSDVDTSIDLTLYAVSDTDHDCDYVYAKDGDVVAYIPWGEDKGVLVNIIHGGLYEYPKVLAGGFGGGDTSPNTDSWDRADDDDNALGCTIDIVTRVVYGDDYREYGFYRRFEIDSAGGVRKIGPETRYTIQS